MVTNFTDWNSRDSLQHYGVLGMKWGERRFQNKDGSLTPAGVKRYAETGEYGYAYKSHATKKYDRKAAKAAAKGQTEKAAKFKQRADISRQIDKREQDYAKSVSAGGTIAMRLLTGLGAKGYQQHMAMNGKDRTTGNKVTAGVLEYFGGSALSRLRKAMVIRSNENTKFGQAGRNLGGNTFEYQRRKEYMANGNKPALDERVRQASIRAAEELRRRKNRG